MNKDILYSTALDEKGNLIHINEAEKGRQYYCPTCKKSFILRKSGKTGKGSKRPHFAHNELTPNCTPESALHYSFKKLTSDLLKQHISKKEELIIDWQCNSCSLEYTRILNKRNLLEKVVYVKEEYDLKDCRPDIALLDEDDNVIAVIEIVVTHEPEESALSYYESHGITLIQVNLTSDENLLEVEELIKKPFLVSFCINPKCSNFKYHKASRKVIIRQSICKNCRSKTRKSHIEIKSVFGLIETKILTKDEVSFSESYGVRYQVKTNNSSKEQFVEEICLGCKISNERWKASMKRMKRNYKRNRRL